MSKDEKLQRLRELKTELHLLYETMAQVGNKHPDEHPIVKKYVDDINKLQNEILKEI